MNNRTLQNYRPLKDDGNALVCFEIWLEDSQVYRGSCEAHSSIAEMFGIARKDIEADIADNGGDASDYILIPPEDQMEPFDEETHLYDAFTVKIIVDHVAIFWSGF